MSNASVELAEGLSFHRRSTTLHIRPHRCTGETLDAKVLSSPRCFYLDVELAEVPTSQGRATHRPVHHIEVVETVVRELEG